MQLSMRKMYFHFKNIFLSVFPLHGIFKNYCNVGKPREQKEILKYWASMRVAFSSTDESERVISFSFLQFQKNVLIIFPTRNIWKIRKAQRTNFCISYTWNISKFGFLQGILEKYCERGEQLINFLQCMWK